MVGNGAIAALVAITAPSGYVEAWAAPFIGAVAGVLVVLAIPAIDKLIDDPVGALSAHGLAGVWGTLSCGIFAAPRLSEYNAFGVTNDDGAFVGGFLHASGLIGKGANAVPGAAFDLLAFKQLGAQALGIVVAFAFVFAASRDVLRSRGSTDSGSRRPRRTADWTSPSTACTDTWSSSSLRVSSRGVHVPERCGIGRDRGQTGAQQGIGRG